MKVSDACSLVFWVACVSSRFTDEIFSGLISAIFTLSAILDLVKVHDNATDKVRAMALRHFCVSDDVPVI